MKLGARQLLDFYLHFAKHRKQLARLAPAINFHQWPTGAFADFNKARNYVFRAASAQKLSAQEPTVQNDLKPVIPRVAMIEHDARQTCGLQYAMDFTNGGGCVRSVMQDAV